MISTTTSPLPEPCGHCGCYHVGGGVCPRIKAIEYHEDGRVKRVEYHDERPPQYVGEPWWMKPMKHPWEDGVWCRQPGDPPPDYTVSMAASGEEW